MKILMAYSTIALSTVLFTFGPAHAFFDDGNGNHSGGASSTMNSNAEARGAANFTMSFSASGQTKGNIDADGEGSMQNMFAGQNEPAYYYRPENYAK